MVARYLVTTADERSWPADRPVLFLGEWCRLYDRRVAWDGLDAVVLPYHWDDRDKLYRDYRYLRQLHELLLGELREALNAFHGVRHSLRYWRILAGPWLGYFTQILFDRWTMIQRAVRDHEIDGTVILDLQPTQVVPNDGFDFTRKYAGDLWNHALYGRILAGWTNVSCERVAAAETPSLPVPVPPPRPSLKRRLRGAGLRGWSLLSRVLTRPTDAFVLASYLPLKQDARLQLALGQMPKLWLTPAAPRVAPDSEIRCRFRLAAAYHQGFDQCVRALIPEQIPTLLLEGYRILREVVDALPWPPRPRVIFTSNNHNVDDVFKAWAASKVEEGAPLVIGQHGGHYGTGLWSYIEEHEQAIADRYFTWGWSDGGAKQYPVDALKLYAHGVGAWNPSGGLLMVTYAMPRYSYFMYSVAVASQTNSYFDDLFRFVDQLSAEQRAQMVVRLFGQDFGWCQAARWRDRHPDVRLDLGVGSMDELIRGSRICVATYNATTFLETLARNIPTVMFWNPKHWELRASAVPYFENLKAEGVLHETPDSAAAHVREVWQDVGAWWNRPEVQDARRRFCGRFALTTGNAISLLKQGLTTVQRQRMPA